MNKHKTFNSNELALKEKHQLLLASIAPRPIGLLQAKAVMVMLI